MLLHNLKFTDLDVRIENQNFLRYFPRFLVALSDVLFIKKLFFVLESEYRFYGLKSGFLNLPGLQLLAQVNFILGKVYGFKGLLEDYNSAKV
jgi:hypothetical protein